MAQLPRCVQQASWKRVSGVCSLTIRSISSATGSAECCSAAGATRTSSGFGLVLRPSQSLLVLCGSSPKLSRSVHTDLTCDRLRFVLKRAPVSFIDYFVSRTSSAGSSGWPALVFSSARSFSAADASTAVDGEVKDPLSTEEKELQNNALLAKIEAKERELEELRSTLRQAEDEAVSSVEYPDVRASSAAAEQVGIEKLSTDGSSSLLAEGEEDEDVDFNSEDSSDEEEIGDIDENAPVISLGIGYEASPGPSTSEDSVEHSESPSFAASAETEETPSEHPWPQWTIFLKFLAKGNYFANEEGKEIDIKSVNPDDYGLIKRACLNFARERDDIFTKFSQKDLEIIARYGCPTTDRKVVNAGKRLREYLKIDEVSICKPCNLRASCERADFRVSSDHVAGTPEVIRLLSQFALNVPSSDGAPTIPELVQKSCTNLLQQVVTLGSKDRDPKAPKFEKKAAMVKSNRDDRMERGPRRRGGDIDIEMKPGDWKCSECEYVNFARNRNCRECDARRPAPEMRPGDWTCPECDFLNFSRNRECHQCKVEKPPGVGFDSSKKGNRGDKEDRFDRGYDRGDRGYGRERESRDFDRGSSRYDSPRGERDRGSLDRADRSRERGSERGSERGMDRRSRGDNERSSYDTRSPRGERDRGSVNRRSAGGDERSGRRNKYEEWKPDLSKKDDIEDEYDDEKFSKKPAKGRIFDDDFDDLDLELDDDEELEDVEAFDDEELEDMKPAASASRSRRGSSDRRPMGRSFDEDTPKWEDDRFSRSSGRGGSRGGRGGGRDFDGGGRDSWSASSSRGGGRGGGRGIHRGAARGRGASGGRARR